MSYLFNAWYAAAWSDEVGQGFFARTLLDIPIMLYRQPTGALVAMHDLCPHRFAPLSLGALVDGHVRCGYHGLSFDSSGACVGSLFSSAVPKAAKVRVFPTVEQDTMIWIWMGDLPPADTGSIPRLSFHTDPTMRCSFGLTTAKADYRLLSDNLMDLTHTALLHPAFGGLDYLPKCKSWEEGDQVISQHICENMPSFLEPGSGKFIHNNDEIRWFAPSTHYLESRATSQDSGELLVFLPSAHILTPETRTTTHYFWSSAQDANSPVSDEEMMQVLVQAFDHEDKPMVEAVQRNMGDADLWDMNPILLGTDAGGVRVRRKLAAMIAAEQKARAES